MGQEPEVSVGAAGKAPDGNRNPGGMQAGGREVSTHHQASTVQNYSFHIKATWGQRVAKVQGNE